MILPSWLRVARPAFLASALVLALVAPPALASRSAATPLHAVGAENFYADVIRQIGGRHVVVTSVLSDPNTDPHAYESSTVDASAVARADFVVANGVGYDDFMAKLENASPNPSRTVIDVGAMFGKKPGDNPHLWFDPATMPRVAARIATELTRRDPADAREFRANLKAFTTSLAPWTTQIARLRKRYAKTPVAVTEPVFNDTLDAVGLDVRTPVSFQLAIEEGNDPAPQDVHTVSALITNKSVAVLVYNEQTVEPSTKRLLALARDAKVPVVGVYETMPRGQTYQSWMRAEIEALEAALAHGRSTEMIR